jgi:phage shock protein C
MTNQTAPRPQHDNLLGICHAIGETFGFNPLILRVSLLVAVMANAEATLIAYAVGGVAVLAAKLATRDWGKTRRTRTPALTHA